MLLQVDALAQELDDAMDTLLDDDADEDDDDEGGFEDECVGMSATEIAELEESLKLVRALLTKVTLSTMCSIHSSFTDIETASSPLQNHHAVLDFAPSRMVSHPQKANVKGLPHPP